MTISINNLTFSHEGSFDTLFDDVSLVLDTDWRLGFTGRNGRGKTTFLNLLRGKYEYSGSISVPLSVDYFPFDVEDLSQKTDSVARSICDYEPWMLERELDLLRVSKNCLDLSFGSLSPGERTKVLLAALFLKQNNFLLIDEPTNHLDSSGREIVASYLSRMRGFILVSHDRRFLDGCVDHILSINKANIEISKGDFSTWLINKELRDNFELGEDKKLRKEIVKLTAASRRTAQWSDKVEKSKKQPQKSGSSLDRGYIGHKAAKMMKRSKSIEVRRESAAEEKSKLLKNIDTAEPLKLSPLKYTSRRLAEFRDLSISYGSNTVFDGLTFEINQGDRISLAGKNGSGKSSVLKLLLGEDISFEGELKIGSNLTISYVSQDTSGLRGTLKELASRAGLDESLFKAILRKLDLPREQFEKDVSDFSGGQKKKVLIAKSLCEKAHLYIWDEPLNFIDVFSRIQIEELILNFNPTLLFVEHDAQFAEKIATKTVRLGLDTLLPKV